MSISNISAKHTINKETPTNQSKTTVAEPFDHIMQEEIATLKLSFSQPPLLSADTSLPRMEENESTEIDHVDAFIHQALAQAPEAERKIWARMKEELGIQ
ncbi:hypothetical protein NB640_01725 [Oxalobacter vibrioformis]|uniref:Uncharacterized protein n=1 Tax=Oxalobacter vibrioformis TaxID=933080 RepID=A0A9E9P3N1_9BURK|nr:hypothetical protein [Oxalobacter vibrioformis]NLC24539.1 hypothetical protein [Oxalobacter sp.]WAW10410.1 hypothetical protein NB640_01725 [Oxalobacter vibrioformis]